MGGKGHSGYFWSFSVLFLDLNDNKSFGFKFLTCVLFSILFDNKNIKIAQTLGFTIIHGFINCCQKYKCIALYSIIYTNNLIVIIFFNP